MQNWVNINGYVVASFKQRNQHGDKITVCTLHRDFTDVGNKHCQEFNDGRSAVTLTGWPNKQGVVAQLEGNIPEKDKVDPGSDLSIATLGDAFDPHAL